MGKKGFVSIFGAVSTQTYNRIHRCEEKMGRKMSILVLDALDGVYVVPFARMGNYIDTYEMNKKYLTGGEINGYNIQYGLNEKIKSYKLDDVKIHNENFYNNN